MKRKILPVILFILAVFSLCMACAGAETVKVYCMERTDLCSSPNGKAAAKIYNGTPADVLQVKGKWSKVRIGEDPVSVTGWILNEHLAPVEENEALYYGQDCIPAQGHDTVPLYKARKKNSAIADVWDGSHEGRELTVAGVLNDNDWLIVAYPGGDGTVSWYYASADSLAGFDGVYIISRAADTVVSLRETPGTKAKILESCFGGVQADVLFDFEQAEGWTRICVGGVAGFMMDDFLEPAEFEVPPYRPPLASLVKPAVTVYANPTGKDLILSHGAQLTQDDLFTVLGRGKTRHHIRIHLEDPGEYVYGWIDEKELVTTELVAGSTKAVISMDTPVLYWDGTECGSVETGQEVVVRWFYDSFPSDESKFLDYFDPDSTQWVWIDVDLDNEIEDWISGGFVPADALDIDEYLILP